MFKSLLKAAQSLERGMDSAFSNAPASHTAFKNTVLTIAGISLRLGSVFAEGGYSFIHVATPVSSNVSSSTRYAVKRLSCSEEESNRQAHREIEFLRKLPSHPNIVKFYDAIFHQQHAFLLFELVDGGTLPEILSRSQLSSQRKLNLLADIAAAIVHLHSQQPPVFIRDIKLENVLYDRIQRCYKLCDFGSATSCTWCPVSRADILAVEEDIANNCTSMYRAPELVDLYSKQLICERADVWSLGCIWYALLFGSLPFDGSSSLQITKGLTNIPTQPAYPEEFISLLKCMLVVQPAHRFDSFQVLERVNQILGRQIDQQLRKIGSELRAKRRDEFGINANSGNTRISSNTSLPADASHVSAPAQQLSQLLLGDFEELSSVSERPHVNPADANPELEVKPNASDNSGWADFDSAFCQSKIGSTANKASTASSQAFKRELPLSGSNNVSRRAHGSTTALPQKSAGVSPGYLFESGMLRHSLGQDAITSRSPAPVSTESQQGQKTAMPSLIDFSDVAQSSRISEQQQESLRAAIAQQRVEKNGSRKAPNFEDLIDFG